MADANSTDLFASLIVCSKCGKPGKRSGHRRMCAACRREWKHGYMQRPGNRERQKAFERAWRAKQPKRPPNLWGQLLNALTSIRAKLRRSLRVLVGLINNAILRHPWYRWSVQEANRVERDRSRAAPASWERWARNKASRKARISRGIRPSKVILSWNEWSKVYAGREQSKSRRVAVMSPWDRWAQRKYIRSINRFAEKGVVVKKVRISDFRRLIEHQQYKCALSGIEVTPETAAIDHRMPLVRGGKHELSNLQAVDQTINRMKHTLTNEEFIAMCRLVVAVADKGQGSCLKPS